MMQWEVNNKKLNAFTLHVLNSTIIYTNRTVLLSLISNLCFLANVLLVVTPRRAASPLGEAVCSLTELTNEENPTYGRRSGNKDLIQVFGPIPKRFRVSLAWNVRVWNPQVSSFSPSLTEPPGQVVQN